MLKYSLLGLLLGSLVGITEASPHSSIKTQSSQLRDKYDFIVAGGGTCGLTIADRLTEAFPNKTVLVIEVGDVEYAPGVFDPPLRSWGGSGRRASSSDFQSLPNPAVKNKTAAVSVGRAVGGSSAINGMFFDRGSRFDYDAWAALGSPDFDDSEDKWDWNGIFPFFKKSVTFTEPSAEAAEKYNYTWNPAAYGGSTPIYSSFPPFLWADHHVARGAWRDMGVRVSPECAAGDKEGICWVPNSQHPITARRSHSGLGHFADVNATRPNYDLLVKHQVIRVIYPDGNASMGTPVVEIRAVVGGPLLNVTASAEVIVSAGALNTPAILQRSGIGPALFLESADIPVVLNLPGVGSNFQDHSGPGFSWNYTTPLSLYPLPSAMLNNTFFAEATAAFDATPAQGPYTLAMSTSAIFVSLPNITANYSDIIDQIRDMATDSGTASAHLPDDQRSDPAMRAGYLRQLEVLADLLSNPRAASIEAPFATGTAMRAFLLHPLSRGTVRIDADNPLRLVLDYRAASNPVDMDLHLAHLRYLRRMIGTPTMQALGAEELTPGSGVSDEDEAALTEYVKDQMTFSFMHPCCTAAMMPRRMGGVVGTDLKVHGAGGLRIVDMSIMPLVPGAHLSATAYAVAEKAADIIIRHWKKFET